MTNQIHVEFNINGSDIAVDAPADQTLLTFLREELGLTGAKNGCSSGHCGACTVIVNGKARRACLERMKKLNGARVLTIEGLAPEGALHPIQQAFIEKGATQCGFCTPGMIMTAKALLDANPRPTADEIKRALTVNHNLCRCTGYVKIIAAIQLAGERLLSPEGRAAGDYPAETVEKVSGTPRYSDDLRPEGMLHGKILWSAHPHAEILRLDTSQAEALPGVAAVITARDIPGKNQLGIIVRDQPAIAADKVRYIGDGLAAVFAEDPQTAQAALDLIQVEYRPLPGVFSPEEAARPDAPKVHAKGNLMHSARIERGDPQGAFERCAAVVEATYTTPMIEHGFLEPESGLAFPDPDGGVTIQIGSQCVFDDRTQLAEILGLPEDKIRVIQLPLGGAFGGKEDMILHQYLALGALKSGRPVKITLCREESLRVHVKRHPTTMYFKVGADSSGRLQALEARIVADSGAYASLTPDVLENMVVFAAGPYFIPHLKLEGWAWYTNNVLCGAMRGFGVNQVAFALEGQLDELAHRLQIDPFEMRLINALDTGLPTSADHVLEPGMAALKETLQAARQAFQRDPLPAPGMRKKVGVGVASAVKNVGFGHGIPEKAGAILEYSASGQVRLKTSQHEYGQGSHSGLARLVSLELGTPEGLVEITSPNTAETPPTGPTTASRQTFLTGNAVVAACRKFKQEITARAAESLNADPGQIELRQDHVIDRSSGRTMPLARLGEKFVIQEWYLAPQSAALLDGERSRYGKPGFESRMTHWCYIFSTQVAVVEVDLDSGAVSVLKVIAAVDVGKALKPTVIEGQIEGGVMMGLGFALSEEFVVEQGINRTTTLNQIHLPGADKTPEIVPVIVEVPHPYGPQGVKGFAEGPSLATAPAILNAIYNAIGVRITSLPANKERIMRALREIDPTPGPG